MADKTGISWTDATWNVVTGCSRVSEGCRNCYAAALAPRLAAMGQKGYTDLPWTKANAPENVFLHEDRLDKPLRWKKPRRVFVNSMSDLFHEQVPDEFIDRVFAVMALASQHTFQILTKRPERMAEYLNARDLEARVMEVALEASANPRCPESARKHMQVMDGMFALVPVLPLSNVWLGTSVENQRAADERIPHLLRTPAAVRFLSCEPLLGPVDLRSIPFRGDAPYFIDPLGYRYSSRPISEHGDGTYMSFGMADLGRIHWVIAGGESGKAHREMEHDWMRKIRDDCAAAGMAFFAKQDAGLKNEMPLPEDLRIRQFPEEAR